MENGKRAFALRLTFFLLLAGIYLWIFFCLEQTPFFDVGEAHNDRLFSADDVYCAVNFYSSQMDMSARIIKHPLWIVFASWLTRLEEWVFGPVSLTVHYGHIVMLQMVLTLLAVLYLERILRTQVRLNQRQTLLLCAVYASAFSVVFYTFVAESYSWSALLLLMSFYYARQKNGSVTVLLGILTAGITITNAVLWAIIVWLGDPGSWRRRLLLLALGGAGFCLVVALLPVGEFFFANILFGGLGSAQSFRDQFPPIEALVRIFFIFFGSTVFYLDTVQESPFGAYAGDALSFLPSASLPVVLAGLVWLGLLVYTVVRQRKNPLLWAPLGVLACNLLLHGAIQYGLKEGFLYSLHHWPAQVLITALAVDPELPKGQRNVGEGLLWGFLLCELIFNLSGYQELLHFIMG